MSASAALPTPPPQEVIDAAAAYDADQQNLKDAKARRNASLAHLREVCTHPRIAECGGTWRTRICLVCGIEEGDAAGFQWLVDGSIERSSRQVADLRKSGPMLQVTTCYGDRYTPEHMVPSDEMQCGTRCSARCSEYASVAFALLRPANFTRGTNDLDDAWLKRLDELTDEQRDRLLAYVLTGALAEDPAAVVDAFCEQVFERFGNDRSGLYFNREYDAVVRGAAVAPLPALTGKKFPKKWFAQQLEALEAVPA